jgi:hypothetical protein
MRPQQVSTQVGNRGSVHSDCPPGQSGVSPQKFTSPVQVQPGPWSVDCCQHWQLLLLLHGSRGPHPAHPEHCGGGGGVAANAGVLMLVRMGADHATAAPAPIRLSIFRREIPSFKSSSLISPPLQEDPSLHVLAGQRIVHGAGASNRTGGGTFLSVGGGRTVPTLRWMPGDTVRGNRPKGGSWAAFRPGIESADAPSWRRLDRSAYCGRA